MTTEIRWHSVSVERTVLSETGVFVVSLVAFDNGPFGSGIGVRVVPAFESPGRLLENEKAKYD